LPRGLPPGPATAATQLATAGPLQGQLADIERKQQEFSDKLEHERNKFKSYEADLKLVRVHQQHQQQHKYHQDDKQQQQRQQMRQLWLVLIWQELLPAAAAPAAGIRKKRGRA
jgi:hypothetical protein